MHSMILGAASYSLLLSSLVTLMVLIRKGLGQHKRTPTYVLSTSDVLSSMFTGILLLLNQLKVFDAIPYDTNDNRTLLLRTTNEEAYQETFQQFQQFHKIYNRNFNSSTSSPCTFNHVIMHYAMFLVPFANAFLSLLSFFVHSNWDTTCTDDRCLQLMELQENNENNKDNTKQHRKATTWNPLTRDDKIQSTVLNVFNETKISKLTNHKDSRLLTALSVIGQWIVPLLLTGILHFSQSQDTSTVRHNTKDMECIFTVNFPFEDRYADIATPMEHETLSLEEYNTTPVANDYIIGSDQTLGALSNPDGKETQAVLSSVYKLIQSLINETQGGGTRTAELWNFTKYLDDNDKVEEEAQEDQVKLLEDTTREAANAKINAETSTRIVNMQGFRENITPPVTSTESPLVINQVYVTADIIKRIQSLTSEYKTEDKIENSLLSDNGRENIHDKLDDPILLAKDNLHFISFENEEVELPRKSKFKNVFYDFHGTTKNQCFLDRRFLQIYLLGLVFFLYFVPILISSILYIRAKYKCQIIMEKLELNNSRNKANSDGAVKTDSELSTVDRFKSQEVKSGWFADNSDRCNESNESNESNENLGESSQAWAKVGTSKNNTQALSPISQETDKYPYLSIRRETTKIQMVSQVLRRSLMVAILLWTPLFLQVLSKVFLCVRTPDWLTNIPFLIGLSFGIVRNFLNLNILHIQRVYEGNNEKENSVHPSSL